MSCSSITARSAPARARSSRPIRRWQLQARAPARRLPRFPPRPRPPICASPAPRSPRELGTEPDDIVAGHQRHDRAQHRRPVARPQARRRDPHHRPRIFRARKDLGLVCPQAPAPRSSSSTSRCRWSRPRPFHDSRCSPASPSAPACCSSATSPRRPRCCSRSNALIAEARKRGIWSVIDGAHTPGHIPLDLDALGADFYSGNCHKWMMSPKGSAFLHARRDMQAMIDPLVISHGWTADNKEPGVRGPVRQFALRRRDRNAGHARSLRLARRSRRARFPPRQRLVDGRRRLPPPGPGNRRAACATLTGLPALSSAEFCAPQMVAMPIPPCDAARRRMPN